MNWVRIAIIHLQSYLMKLFRITMLKHKGLAYNVRDSRGLAKSPFVFIFAGVSDLPSAMPGDGDETCCLMHASA